MALSISRSFEGGLYAITGAQDITDTYIGAGDSFIHLRPVLTYDTRYNAYGIKITGANGWTPDFRLNTANGANPSNVNRWEASWSYDPHGDTWNRFDTITRVDATTFTFANNAPFTQDTVYIHMAPFFSYTRWLARFEQFKLSSYVTSGAGLSTPYVLHSLPAVTDPFSGRVIGAKDVHYMRISDWSVTAPKIPIFWMHGQHCDETVGAYVYEGAIDFLLSADPMAHALRQTCEFHVLLHVNPQGLDAGYYRSSPEGGGNRDHNREWQAAVPRYSVIPVIRDLLRSLKPQGFFDFHSRQEASNHYLYLSASRTETTTTYHARLNARHTTSVRDSDIATSVRTFVQTDSELGPVVTPLQVTVEPSPHINQTPTTLRAFGVHVVRAIHDLVDEGILFVEGGADPEPPEGEIRYHVERRSPAGSGTYAPYASNLTEAEVQFISTNFANGSHQFRVRAENTEPATEGERYSEWSTPRTLIVDNEEEEPEPEPIGDTLVWLSPIIESAPRYSTGVESVSRYQVPLAGASRYSVPVRLNDTLIGGMMAIETLYPDNDAVLKVGPIRARSASNYSESVATGLSNVEAYFSLSDDPDDAAPIGDVTLTCTENGSTGEYLVAIEGTMIAQHLKAHAGSTIFLIVSRAQDFRVVAPVAIEEVRRAA